MLKGDKKSGYGGLAFSFFFRSSIRNDDLGATEQLTQGLWVCWSGQVSENGARGGRQEPPSRVRFKEWHTAVVYRPIEAKRPSGGEKKTKRQDSFAHQEAKGPEFNNASITGQPTCSFDMYGENDLALQLLFFPPQPSRQLLRFDFNAFCVVLYFHAKILLYLNVFILLNVFHFFWLLYPRIAVIIHVTVSNFFLWKRSEKKKEKH